MLLIDIRVNFYDRIIFFDYAFHAHRHSKPKGSPMNQQGQSYSDVEMKVELTNTCRHGRCRFCSPLFRPTVEEADIESFLRSFERNLDGYLANGGRRIILTGGGEPIDAPEKLFGALRLVREKKAEFGVDLDLLTVYSNGVSLLKPISRNTTVTYLDKLALLGVQDINLSVHGRTREERTGISGEAMGNVDFADLVPQIVRKGIRVMTRTTLASGYIDSVEKIDDFVRWMARLGVQIAYFSDLFQVPIRDERTTPGSQTVLHWTDDHRICFDALLEEMRHSEAFAFVSESTRHQQQGRTFEFRHYSSGVKVLLGDLVIGNEAEERPTYAYVKPDGSTDMHNNARDISARRFVSPNRIRSYLRIYRPGRDDL